MLETKEQKGTLVIVVLLILMLSVVSLWDRQGFKPQNQQSGQPTEDNFLKSQAYLNYLNSLEIDKSASDKLFKEILSEEEIKQEVEKALKVDQEIKVPEVSDAALNISSNTGKEAVESYLSEVLSKTMQFSGDVSDLNKELLSGDLYSVQQLKNKYSQLYEQLKGVEIPKDVVDMHKAMLASYISYGRLIETSKAYAAGEEEDPWPNMYGNYVVINDQAEAYRGDLEKIAKKYEIASIPVTVQYAEEQTEIKVPLIKTAHAFIPGVPDVSITISDVPRLIWEGIREGLVASFSQFMGNMLSNLIAKIESNYLIANFLYYTDALVQGQYTEDYLKKYVYDTFDREVIKTFIPQFACGAGNQFLAPVFQAKAQEYLGFDINNLTASDPDFYEKAAKVGDFLSSPQGWKFYYQDVASQTKSEAEKAAERELISPGLKTPRDSINSAISQSINSIVSAQRAAFNSLLNLGAQKSEYAISAFVSVLTQQLVDKFVFKGASSNGSVGVLLEQPTCLATAQLKLLLPLNETDYVAPPPPQDEQDLYRQECKKYPTSCYTGYYDCLNGTGDAVFCAQLFP